MSDTRPSAFVVIEGPPAVVARARRQAIAGGWTVEPGFDRPYRPGRRVRTGEVGDADDARAALLAAFAGQRLIIRATAQREVVDRLVDDLRRLGPVDHRLDPLDDPPDVRPEGRAILELLARGWSLGQAATALGLSRRTADRRLAEARQGLGTARTVDAVRRARQLGWLADGEGRAPDGER